MQPVRHIMRSSSGMAVIALDLSSTVVWASTRRLACAPAPVMGAAHVFAVDGHDLAEEGDGHETVGTADDGQHR